MPSSRGKVDSIILPLLNVIVCGHWKFYKMAFNYMEEIFMPYSQYLNHSEKECCGWIFPQSIRRKSTDPLSTQTEAPHETVGGKLVCWFIWLPSVQVLRILVGDQRIPCPTNRWTVFIFLFFSFLRGREVGSNLGLAYSRGAELHPNPGLFLLIVMWIYNTVTVLRPSLNMTTEINNIA